VSKFFDTESGATILMDRFYGFGDAGGIAGSFDGYATQEEAISEIAKEHGSYGIGTKPSELGSCAICILNGQQFVDQLRSLDPSDADHINIYGHFID